MSWTLTYQGEEKSFAQWGLSHLTRKLVNQSNDVVSLRADGTSLDAPLLFAPESAVTIQKSGKPWFYGIVTQVPSVGYATSENQSYTIAGPWWFLENLVYQQGWAQAKQVVEGKPLLEAIDTGRVILGQDKEGNPINNGRQIREVLEYSLAQGAPITIGEIGVDVIFPYDETKDISCAEAIQRLLRWSPDAVVWFDYSVLPYPMINIKRREALKKSTIALDGNSGIKCMKITPRYDLQSRCVVIKYEKNHVLDGQSWTTTEVDAFPQGADGKDFKSLVLTVELDGARVQSVSQAVKVAMIYPESANWWKAHVPSLEGIPSEKITIDSYSRKKRSTCRNY